MFYAIGIGAVVLFLIYSQSGKPTAPPAAASESHGGAQLSSTARVATAGGRFKCPEVLPCDCSAEGVSSAGSNLLSAVASAAAAAAAEAAQCPASGACPKCPPCAAAAAAPAAPAAPEHPCVKASKSPFQFDTSCVSHPPPISHYHAHPSRSHQMYIAHLPVTVILMHE